MILTAVFLLAACSTAPSTPTPGAVNTAVAQTIAAWTTVGSAFTNIPIPTNTLAPTAISSGQTEDNVLLPEPTVTATLLKSSTNLIIDVTTILGKPVPEVEEFIGKTVFITPYDDHDDVLAGGEYRDYEIGKYYVFLSFDEDGIA